MYQGWLTRNLQRRAACSFFTAGHNYNDGAKCSQKKQAWKKLQERKAAVAFRASMEWTQSRRLFPVTPRKAGQTRRTEGTPIA
jgi:hypothetical protein